MSIRLHQFVLDWDLPNASPFCLKLETWLRMAQLDYEVVPWTPQRAPHGKAPFVEVDGETIADSSTIVRRLTERFQVGLDNPLTPAQRATGHLVRRTLEEHTYFALLCDRWLVDEVWADYRHIIGQPLPALIRGPMTAWLRRDVRRVSKAQGLGRHDLDEVRHRAIADVDAVLGVLGEGPYLHGDTPTSVDATVYAFLAVMAHPIGRGPFAEHVRQHPAVTAYVERMTERFWADASVTR